MKVYAVEMGNTDDGSNDPWSFDWSVISLHTTKLGAEIAMDRTFQEMISEHYPDHPDKDWFRRYYRVQEWEIQ